MKVKQSCTDIHRNTKHREKREALGPSANLLFDIVVRRLSQQRQTRESNRAVLVPPRWPSGKASASRAEDPGLESRLRRDFFGVESLLTYLCPSLPVEHRPSTTPRHRTLFWAALVIPDQLVPCCFSSASVSRLQLLRGRPLFLFPCGFQVRAWRVVLDAGFLRVCPIQPHFLRSICLATASCPARSHRSSFRIFSCHWIL